ncbi:MAG TPA: fibronectin type III domain-containing protein, partial [Fibrobacteria bacterium]|nr:fibronectin type III domain-containing protein [Fibrobacteria bacterium]
MTSGNTDRQTLVTFGCDSLKAVHGPGFEWSTVDNKMVGWAGGTSVYTMDTTFTCSEVPASVQNTVTPASPSRFGTFGRWRYIPKYNVFMVVNSTNGNVYFYRHSAYNPSAATVEITSPAENFLTNQGTVPVTWTVNGINQTSGTTETLKLEGANLVKRCHVNVCDSVTVIRDQTPPAVVITQPASSHVTTDATIWVRWTLDGIPKSFYYSLVPGTNLIVVDFTDAAGNRGADTVTVTRGSPSSGRPIFPSGANLVASNIRSTSMTLSWTAATASAGLKQYVLYKDRAPIATIRAPSTTYTAVGLLRGKDHEFRVEAVDSAQRMSINGPLRIFRTDDQLPPEPATVATPIPHGQPTLLASAVAFLHEGPNSIQSGVTDSLMDPVRTVVVRGAVRTRSGSMLPGVTVSVLGHSEVGSTLSRQNGEFDLVINGGGSLVLVYAAEGYLESQRTFHPRWQEYVVLDTVTLVTRDTVVNTVDLSSAAPMQAIQAGGVTDESGTRRATLIVPSGARASLLLPDGTRQPLGSMRVRMTEYTVGAAGPSAMPASLPPSSAYTYALDYSVEEALAANAGGVVFETPIHGYVENFVGIPVG